MRRETLGFRPARLKLSLCPKMIEGAFELLASSSIFIALNSSLAVLASFMLYGAPVDPAALLSAFLITFSVYSLNKLSDYVEDKVNNPGRLKLIGKRRKAWAALSLAAAALSVALGALKSPFTVLVLLSPFIVASLYSFKPLPRAPRLKDIPGVKSLSVALSWALTGSLLPLTLEVTPWPLALASFTLIFTMIFVNTVLFDVRDVRGDAVAGVKTIPIALGLAKTRRLLYAANLLLLLPVSLLSYYGAPSRFHLALAFGALYNILVTGAFCRENIEKPLLLDLVVDGEWIPLTLFLAVVAALAP
ncbi:MAG: UbiA family prenyltransferase [Desulfurococcaceae archaeon]